MLNAACLLAYDATCYQPRTSHVISLATVDQDIILACILDGISTQFMRLIYFCEWYCSTACELISSLVHEVAISETFACCLHDGLGTPYLSM